MIRSRRTCNVIQNDIHEVNAQRAAAFKAGNWDAVDRIQLTLDALGEELVTCEEAAEYFADYNLRD